MNNDNYQNNQTNNSDVTAPLPSVQASQPMQTSPGRGGHAWRYLGLIFFCFVASFLGSWMFINSGLVNLSATTIENREKIVSQEGEAIADVAERVSPGVVSIVTESFDRNSFFSGRQASAGTGFVISKDGYVLTNKHVLGNSRTASVAVVMSDGTVHENVQIVGRDPLNDLAFLKIKDVSDLKPVELGDSSELQVGSKVIAIGNALGEYQTTVTSGIISGLGRPLTAASESGESVETLENLLQTDAAINPGNSGGPLLTLDGKVIGINTAIAQDAEGIGFAIPINDAKGLIKSVLEKGRVERAFLGIRYLTITPAIKDRYELTVDQGAYIPEQEGGSVVSGSPADKAGLKAGDVIIKIDDTEVTQARPLSSIMSGFTVDDSVMVTYIRDGGEQSTRVTLEQYRQ